jgi:hypothetical protein
MDELPRWVLRAIGIIAGLIALVILARNLRWLMIGGWGEYWRDAYRIDSWTWWLLGFFVVCVLILLAIWAFPCGGILVAG